VAWYVLKPGIAPEFWEWTCQDEAPDAPSHVQSATWRELRPRPVNPADAMAVITGMRDQQIDRLTKLLDGHAQWAAEEAVDLPDRAAFDSSAGFERHRRYRTALGREMLRTLDTLRKLRKDGRDMEYAGCNPGGVTDLKETDKIGILSHVEEQTDKVGPGALGLARDPEGTDAVGGRTHKDDGTKTEEVSSRDENEPEKAPNEPKPESPQAISEVYFSAGNCPDALAKRSHSRGGDRQPVSRQVPGERGIGPPPTSPRTEVAAESARKGRPAAASLRFSRAAPKKGAGRA
jgi:hypothetical protein